MLRFFKRSVEAAAPASGAPILALGSNPDIRDLVSGLGGRLIVSDDIGALVGSPGFREAELILVAAAENAAAVAASRSGMGGEIIVLTEDPIEQIGLRDLDARLLGVRVRPVSRAAALARTLLAEIAVPDRVLRDGAAHVLIVGTAGPVPAHLAMAALRLLQLPGIGVRVTLAGRGMAAMLDRLRAALPELDACGTIGTAEHASARLAPTLVLECDETMSGIEGGVRAVLPSWAETASRLRDAGPDRIARAIHAMHLEERAAAGGRMGDQPSQAPWDDLPERFREAARHSASHIPFKLRWAGARVGTAGPDPFGWTGAELLALSEAEHRRWAAVARLEGWSFGPVRDDATKRTPMLVDFDALSQDVKDLDALPVRAAIGHLGQPTQRDVVIALHPAAEMPEPGFDWTFQAALARFVTQQGKRPVVLRLAHDTPLVRAAAAVARSAGVPMQFAAMDAPSAALSTLMERVAIGPQGVLPPYVMAIRVEAGGQVTAC